MCVKWPDRGFFSSSPSIRIAFTSFGLSKVYLSLLVSIEISRWESNWTEGWNAFVHGFDDWNLRHMVSRIFSSWWSADEWCHLTKISQSELCDEDFRWFRRENSMANLPSTSEIFRTTTTLREQLRWSIIIIVKEEKRKRALFEKEF